MVDTYHDDGTRPHKRRGVGRAGLEPATVGRKDRAQRASDAARPG
jgi:hypothetical protein